MKGQPTKPTEIECTDTLLNGINCSRYSIVWHKYSGRGAPKPSYANLKAELFQSEKYFPTLFSDSILANMATSTSSTCVSSKSPPVIMKATEAQEFHPDVFTPKPTMCGAMKATHPTRCSQYGIICKTCGNIGHALLFCQKQLDINKASDQPKSHSNKANRSKHSKDNKLVGYLIYRRSLSPSAVLITLSGLHSVQQYLPSLSTSDLLHYMNMLIT